MNVLLLLVLAAPGDNDPGLRTASSHAAPTGTTPSGRRRGPSGDVEVPTLKTAEPKRLAPVGVTIGVKIGPYYPNMDRELSNAAPFADIFEDSRSVYVAPQVRLLWQVMFLDIGVAATIGWTEQSANAWVDDGGPGQPASKKKRSGGETSLSVIPAALLGVVRLNVLYGLTGVPLVPYLEAGGVYAVWQIEKGDGTEVASGGSVGYRVNVGAALRLEALEPAAAKSLSTQFGIHSTELSFEWSHTATRVLRVGDSTWTAGIAVGF